MYVAAKIFKADPQAEALSTVGPPASNCKLYVVDNQLQPLPIGVPGELYISGVCLAEGYLNQAGETAKKYITNPFCAEAPYERMYKTGDLARWLPDGSIQIIGRVDHQVDL